MALVLAVAMGPLLIAGCASNSAITESRALLAEGRIEDSVSRLAQALRENPADKVLRTQYFRQRDQVLGQLLSLAQAELMADRRDAAQAALQRVLDLDPGNGRARDGLADIARAQRHDQQLQEAAALAQRGDAEAAQQLVRAVLVENPGHVRAQREMQQLRAQASREQAAAQALASPFAKPITLEFRDTTLRTVFEVIARTSGINFVFDKDVRADTKVTIFMRNTSIDDVVKLLLATNQLDRKLLNENSMLIYPGTPAKTREYAELVTRSFYLANADVKQAQAMVRALVKTRDVFVDEKLNLLVMKDTPEAVLLAERLLESLDMAEPEVMLDVEVLEVTRSKLLDLGLQFPDQVGYGLLQPSSNSTIVNNGVTQTNTNLGGTLAPGFVDLRNRSGLTSFVTNPALLLNLRNQDGDGNLLANPRIRVKNREKAKIHIGEKLPVFTTTSTANVGVSASVAYLDVGLKLEVEPNVFLDDDVAIKVSMEVSSIVKEVPGPSSSLAYQVGTRSVATTLRLRNGETQVLAGLISDEERNNASRLPGLGDVPLLGRLFSTQRNNNNKTEIVLLITPRIVRNINRPLASGVSIPAGSETSIGAPALVLRKTEPRSLGLSSTPTGGAASGPGSLPPPRFVPPLPAPIPLAPATDADPAQTQEQAGAAATPPGAAGQAGVGGQAGAPAETPATAAPPVDPNALRPITINPPSISAPFITLPGTRP